MQYSFGSFNTSASVCWAWSRDSCAVEIDVFPGSWGDSTRCAANTRTSDRISPVDSSRASAAVPVNGQKGKCVCVCMWIKSDSGTALGGYSHAFCRPGKCVQRSQWHSHPTYAHRAAHARMSVSPTGRRQRTKRPTWCWIWPAIRHVCVLFAMYMIL